jgi:hypothetical protein
MIHVSRRRDDDQRAEISHNFLTNWQDDTGLGCQSWTTGWTVTSYEPAVPDPCPMRQSTEGVTAALRQRTCPRHAPYSLGRSPAFLGMMSGQAEGVHVASGGLRGDQLLMDLLEFAVNGSLTLQVLPGAGPS